MPDKIGIIGYTQGVQDRANPAKNAPKNKNYVKYIVYPPFTEEEIDEIDQEEGGILTPDEYSLLKEFPQLYNGLGKVKTTTWID